MTAADHQADDIIATDADLDALYGKPHTAALAKELDHISDHYRAFVDAAPFVALATMGPDGLDCSPRGDPAGFVKVVDRKTVMLPDRRGNNRIDSLRNIVRDPRVSLLFLIPGIGETLRIKGRARISADPDLLQAFAINDKPPITVLIVTVDRVYFQCQKALVRSRLWDPEARVPRSQLPSTGAMLQAVSRGDINGDAYDRAYPQRMKETLY